MDDLLDGDPKPAARDEMLESGDRPRAHYREEERPFSLDLVPRILSAGGVMDVRAGRLRPVPTAQHFHRAASGVRPSGDQAAQQQQQQ